MRTTITQCTALCIALVTSAAFGEFVTSDRFDNSGDDWRDGSIALGTLGTEEHDNFGSDFGNDPGTQPVAKWTGVHADGYEEKSYWTESFEVPDNLDVPYYHDWPILGWEVGDVRVFYEVYCGPTEEVFPAFPYPSP